MPPVVHLVAHPCAGSGHFRRRDMHTPVSIVERHWQTPNQPRVPYRIITEYCTADVMPLSRYVYHMIETGVRNPTGTARALAPVTSFCSAKADMHVIY